MKHHVWVVDDDRLILDTLGPMLTELGHHVRTFDNPEKLLREYRITRPDVIIADLRMPSMSGVELTRLLKEEDPDALVIILTGYPSIEDAVEAIHVGAVDFMSKPCRIEELDIRIRNTLNNKLVKTRLSRNRVLVLTLLETLPIWVILGMIVARFLR